MNKLLLAVSAVALGYLLLVLRDEGKAHISQSKRLRKPNSKHTITSTGSSGTVSFKLGNWSGNGGCIQ